MYYGAMTYVLNNNVPCVCARMLPRFTIRRALEQPFSETMDHLQGQIFPLKQTSTNEDKIWMKQTRNKGKIQANNKGLYQRERDALQRKQTT